jgi:hypothetical protein
VSPQPVLASEKAAKRDGDLPMLIALSSILVLEERAKQQLNLPMMISFGVRRKRAGIAQNLASMLDKFRFAVERLV